MPRLMPCQPDDVLPVPTTKMPGLAPTTAAAVPVAPDGSAQPSCPIVPLVAALPMKSSTSVIATWRSWKICTLDSRPSISSKAACASVLVISPVGTTVTCEAGIVSGGICAIARFAAGSAAAADVAGAAVAAGEAIVALAATTPAVVAAAPISTVRRSTPSPVVSSRCRRRGSQRHRARDAPMR